MTEKTTTKINKDTGKVELAGFAKLIDYAKRNPAVLIALASAVGVGCEELTKLIQADLPGYLLGLVVVFWWGVGKVNKHLNSHARLVSVVEQMADDMRDVKQLTATLAAENAEQFVAVNHRLSLIENVFKAEIAAYVEKHARDTARVRPPA